MKRMGGGGDILRMKVRDEDGGYVMRVCDEDERGVCDEDERGVCDEDEGGYVMRMRGGM